MKLKTKTEIKDYLKGALNSGSPHTFDAIAEHVQFEDVKDCGALDSWTQEDWGVVRPLTDEQIALELRSECENERIGSEENATRRTERARGRLLGLVWLAGFEAMTTDTPSWAELRARIAAALSPQAA